MKTTLYIITFLLTLSFSTLYAGEGSAPSRTASAGELTPMVPKEVTFDVVSDDPVLVRWLLKVLAPSTPKVADFNEAAIADTLDMKSLLPTVPMEADFDDSF